MKKLLTTITISALVGTSASDLKPMFTNTITNHGFKSNQVNNKDISIENQNSSNPFISEFKDLQNKKIEKVIIAPNGTIYAGSSTTGLWKSVDGINFNKVNGIPNSYAIQSIDIAFSGEIWVGTDQYLYFSNDNGISFNSITNDKINNITSIAIAPNGTIWVGTEKEGQRDSGLLYKSTDGINFKSLSGIVKAIKCVYLSDGNIYLSDGGLVKGHLIDNLFKNNKSDYFGNLYDGFVYKNEQKIDIKDKFITTATLDGSSITVPTTDLDIPSGEHNLSLTLKDEYKQYLDLFDGDVTTGTVTYKLWVKTSIDKNDIKYSTNKDDTELYSGLVSNVGNTKNADIIQTKSKKGSSHPANLDLTINDKLIDFDINKSFYEQGAVDSSNNFTANPSSKKTVSQNLSIKTDGIYHLHLVDTVGNTYDSYLELGESNWKLKGTFDDSELDKLKTKLNVTVNLTDPNQKSKALGWLQQYDNFVKNKFNHTIKTNGKGFDNEIKNQITSYTAFLKPLTYDISNEPKFDDGLDKLALVTTITDKANDILNKGLVVLPRNLNINTSNVVNKSTLEHYTNWINNYQTFINQNKDTWIKNIANIASRGFATTEQENQIKEQVSRFLNNDNIKNYLKSVVWENNKLLKATSNDYQQYIELDKLQTDTINWVNSNESTKDIVKKYQQAINNAESGLNLHGYSIDTLLNGKQKPQIKSEIDNFADGQSYHDWLQSQANIKFHGYQLAMGFGIAIPLLLVVVAIGWVIRSRTNPKYNGVARARKDLRQERKQMKKKIIKK